MKALIATLAILVVGLYLLFRPVCVPIDAADLQTFSPPINEREETNFYGLKVFQKKGDRWHQCKTWIARQFFF